MPLHAREAVKLSQSAGRNYTHLHKGARRRARRPPSLQLRGCAGQEATLHHIEEEAALQSQGRWHELSQGVSGGDRVIQASGRRESFRVATCVDMAGTMIAWAATPIQASRRGALNSRDMRGVLRERFPTVDDSAAYQRERRAAGILHHRRARPLTPTIRREAFTLAMQQL